MKKKGHVVASVAPGSIGEEMEIVPGDKVLAINDTEIEDIFDYRYLIEDEYIELLLEKADGELLLLEIDKEYEEDLGLAFENGLMDEYRSCRNKCVFCFIDQMPPGMRKTLYFKDDDSRLSFLQGNYVTLTNVSDKDLKRIIRFHLSPINVSVQTTNPDLRCEMLNNRFAGEALKKLDALYEAGITMNGQIVLCRDLNDGKELERTIRDLSAYCPVMQSVSVVPVGLSKYREGLYPLESVTKEGAKEAIDLIEAWQKVCFEKYGLHFVHASDELYILAERELPEAKRYDGYPQLENGVGMLRLLYEEVMEALEEVEGDDRVRHISMATGKLAEPYVRRLLEEIKKKFPGISCHLYAIRNDFFGERITVSGLITGTDLICQLQGRPLGEELLLPVNMFRSEEEVFLDDITRSDVETALQLPVGIVKSTGKEFLYAVINEGQEEKSTWQPYEIKELNQNE